LGPIERRASRSAGAIPAYPAPGGESNPPRGAPEAPAASGDAWPKVPISAPASPAASVCRESTWLATASTSSVSRRGLRSRVVSSATAPPAPLTSSPAPGAEAGIEKSGSAPGPRMARSSSPLPVAPASRMSSLHPRYPCQSRPRIKHAWATYFIESNTHWLGPSLFTHPWYAPIRVEMPLNTCHYIRVTSPRRLRAPVRMRPLCSSPTSLAGCYELSRRACLARGWDWA